jgi:hypothetical protein
MAGLHNFWQEFDLDELLTHEVTLQDIEKAFELLKQPDCVKVLIKIWLIKLLIKPGRVHVWVKKKKTHKTASEIKLLPVLLPCWSWWKSNFDLAGALKVKVYISCQFSYSETLLLIFSKYPSSVSSYAQIIYKNVLRCFFLLVYSLSSVFSLLKTNLKNIKNKKRQGYQTLAF